MGIRTTVTVSIGRNIPEFGRPMGEQGWQEYSAQVARVIREHSSAVHFIGYGQGNHAGQEEESFTVVATSDLTQLSPMRDCFEVLARTYRQDSIAVTSGATRFVGANA